ncbi:MAG: dienelactone hydrolase family protein [Blastocatellia bacterium]|nr:dienelactone hydrolase family protein [Blastocatellia bacterium]
MSNRAETVLIPLGGLLLEADLNIPENAKSIVIFVHGSGSNRRSPRNQYVAEAISRAGIGTLLFDLHSTYQFDIDLLTGQLVDVTEWVAEQNREIKVGYFGASTGGAVALVAAARQGGLVTTVVSRGGRPDLAGNLLCKVESPTLLIVGAKDEQVTVLNKRAYELLNCTKELVIVSGASHLFEEAGKLEEVANIAVEWFKKYL